MGEEGKSKDHQKEMDVVGHLSELRNRIMVTAVFFLIFFIAGFIYVEDIYWFFAKELDFQLTAISPGEILWLYFSMAGVVAICGTLPIISYQIWAFVKPGLTPNERKVSLPYIPAIFILFLAGLVFGYFLFTEFIIPFLLHLNNGMFDVMFTVDRYFKFLLRVTLPLAILFELPIIVMFLTSLGILTPDFMKKTRRYAYFLLIVISAMITPPDFILPLLVSIPLILIYEISISLSGRVYRKKQKKHEEFMHSESV
ncbi:twin-arginine translocase subunit TatC [Oceanobacillus salinisoli]|uniref:twin-arginine translocase subunit TatC n=1 Tax=Oceanobacillus salinisoli TaxID=2678611 RepID=UPI0012E230C8|nr:twin-arginine translocase subunit TatC [Oceanobacillus salinisoli]